MFCCSCGTELPDHAQYCLRCGAPVTGASRAVLHGKRRADKSDREYLDPEEQSVVDELLPLSQKPDECHRCGKKEGLTAYPFGLGKVLSTRRKWADTAWSVVVSAVSLPLVGYGGLNLPGKETLLRVLKLRLILCDACRRKKIDYAFHPWWHGATRLGFTQFLTQSDLEKLRAV